MRIILSFILIAMLNRAYCQQDSVQIPDSAAMYYISVLSEPVSARVYLDTVLAGITPLERIPFKEGKYSLKVVNPNSPSGWENENFFSELILIRDTVINVKFRYFYYLNSNPYNAFVYKNDTLFGITPLRYLSESRLYGNLLFKKSNYKDYIYNLDGYDFEKGAVINMVSKGKESVNDIVMKNRGTQFKTKRNLLYVLGFGGLSLAGAFFSVNFKDKANNNYEKYLLTGDSFYLDESNKNDKYFIASIVIMQLAIGGLIYFLFFD